MNQGGYLVPVRKLAESLRKRQESRFVQCKKARCTDVHEHFLDNRNAEIGIFHVPRSVAHRIRQLNRLWPPLTPACLPGRHGFDSLKGHPL